ncbi:MAG TPA: hypothetical protein VMC09_13590 [Anaerolineales bacterium]|nr:hypothetical protein [Anaerolineales bacterium]
MNTLERPMLTGPHKPGKIQAVGIVTLVSGISNIFWMLILTTTVILPLGIASYGIGCLLVFFVVPPIVLGIFEIVYAAKLLPDPIKATKPSMALAILEIVCFLTGNLLSVGAGIVALVMYNDPEVKAYFQRSAPAAMVVA